MPKRPGPQGLRARRAGAAVLSSNGRVSAGRSKQEACRLVSWPVFGSRCRGWVSFGRLSDASARSTALSRYAAECLPILGNRQRRSGARPTARPRRRIASIRHEQENDMAGKNTICLWYDDDALEAAQFYAKTFPDSAVGAVHRAPGDYPSGKQGDVLTVEFTVAGIPCIGLNGGTAFRHSEAFSFQIATDDQAETDRLWNAIVGNGGQESACGWCKDKWGLSWQITPRVLIEAVADPDRAAARRAFDAMMQMRKIDIATIEAAWRG